MNLQERLQKIKDGSADRIPKEDREIMHRATEDLQNSDILNRAVKEGDKAPDFTLENTKGEAVHLGSLLKDGPVVLSFFRGNW